MAIFGKHIKGTGDGKIYSGFKWSEASLPNKPTDKLTFVNAPEILTDNGNVDQPAITLGNILTSGLSTSLHLPGTGKAQEGSAFWRITPEKEKVIVEMNQIENIQTNNFITKIGNSTTTPTKGSIQALLKEGELAKDLFTITCSAPEEEPDLSDKDHFKFSSNIYSEFTKTVYCRSYLEVEYGCRASYFAAKSDKRAKDNLVKVGLSALDFINQLNIYTFNYKNKHEVSLGVVAQEVLDTEWGSLLVDNPTATGLNDDFMSIKESKLVYVLLKAIQEEHKEIQYLKAQLAALKGENKYE